MSAQRKFPRFECQLPIIVSNEVGKPLKAFAENISLGGFLLRQKFLNYKLGNMVFIEVADGELASQTLAGKVVHVRQESDDKESDYLIGIEFQRITKLSKKVLDEYIVAQKSE